MHLSVVAGNACKDRLNLDWYRHQIKPSFEKRGLSERYNLEISEPDKCVYVENKGDPDRRYVVGFASEFADKKMHVITNRLDWIARK